MTDGGNSESAGGRVVRSPPIIRAACFLLLAVGLVSATFSFPVVVDPSAARCHLGRTWVEQANDDNKDWNNVDIGGRQHDDVPCDEAIVLADGIHLKENDPSKTASVPSGSALRIQNALSVVMGAGQALGGSLVLRRLSRQARNMALGISAAGIILQVLGIISLAVFAFVFYALAFSADSRQIWPREPRGPRGPRGPRPEAA